MLAIPHLVVAKLLPKLDIAPTYLINIQRLKMSDTVNLSEPWKTLNNLILNDQFKVIPAVE